MQQLHTPPQRHRLKTITPTRISTQSTSLFLYRLNCQTASTSQNTKNLLRGVEAIEPSAQTTRTIVLRCRCWRGHWCRGCGWWHATSTGSICKARGEWQLVCRNAASSTAGLAFRAAVGNFLHRDWRRITSTGAVCWTFCERQYVVVNAAIPAAGLAFRAAVRGGDSGALSDITAGTPLRR
jgi:hypothetical protein